MNRRAFLTAVIVTPIVAAITPEVPWIHDPKGLSIYFDLKMLQETMNNYRNQIDWTIYGDFKDPALFGIPYHQSDASTGSWLGFERK